jgi:hypothetical protein
MAEDNGQLVPLVNRKELVHLKMLRSDAFEFNFRCSLSTERTQRRAAECAAKGRRADRLSRQLRARESERTRRRIFVFVVVFLVHGYNAK